MVIDARGLTVGESPLVPWSHIDHVTVAPVGRRFLTISRGVQVVAFVPKPGIDMPPPPGARRVRADTDARWKEARIRANGTNLTVVPGLFTVSARELIAAAERWGGVEVRWLKRNPRTLR